MWVSVKQVTLLQCIVCGCSGREEREKQKHICPEEQTKSTILVLKMSSQEMKLLPGF